MGRERDRDKGKDQDHRRVSRMEKEVLHSVAHFLLSQYRPSLPAIITATQVKMPADLRAAKVYVSLIFNAEQSESKTIDGSKSEVAAVLEDLQKHASDFQQFLAHQLKSRYCPKLTFFLDETTEHVLKVERLLKDLHQEDRPKSNED